MSQVMSQVSGFQNSKWWTSQNSEYVLTVNSVVRYATFFVSRIHFNRRTSLEVEITQRTLGTAKDLGIFLLKWVGKDGRLSSSDPTDHSQEVVEETY